MIPWLLSFHAAFAQDSAVAPAIGAAALPRDLSPWGMFMNADAVVKAVVVVLAIASLLTWTIWLAKSIEIMQAKRKARAGLRAIGARKLDIEHLALPDARDAIHAERFQRAFDGLALRIEDA